MDINQTTWIRTESLMRDLLHWILILSIYITWIFTPTGCEGAEGQKCHFPPSWRGRWWQSGLGDVVIRESVMSTKGSCHGHHRDYYLVYKRDHKCYQCLLIMERHKNLMQYKESYCSDENSLEKVCAQIRVESPLYSLVREPNVHIRCPFHDAYYFNYNNHLTGFCDNPLSYARPCVGQHQYQLHFQHCVQDTIFHGRDLELECLATWKDGSDMYLYGRFSGPGVVDKDSAYRCFKYDYEGNQLLLSMSLDPTCRGLRSARDGPVIFKFTKDINGWPPPVCQFPEWLQGTVWRDIEGRNSYELDDKAKEIAGYYRKRVNSRSHMKYQFRCMEILEEDLAEEEMTLLSFSTHRCVSKHQCLRLKRIKDGVVQLSQGSLVDYDGNGRCFDDAEYHTHLILISDSAHPIECPSPGFYSIQEGGECIENLDVGCSNSSTMQLVSSCVDNQQFHLQCMAWWHGEGRTFIAVREQDSDSRLLNCFSFRERGAIMEFGTDRNCNRGIPNLYRGNIRHTVLPLGHCSQFPVIEPTPQKVPPTEPNEGEHQEIEVIFPNEPTKPPYSTNREEDLNVVDGADPYEEEEEQDYEWMQDADHVHIVNPGPNVGSQNSREKDRQDPNYPYSPEHPGDSNEGSSAKISIESPVDPEEDQGHELSPGDDLEPQGANSHLPGRRQSTNAAHHLHHQSHFVYISSAFFLTFISFISTIYR